MAGIDKIYLTEEQYKEFHRWCTSKEKAIFKATGEHVLDSFYDSRDYIPFDDGTFPATNFPEVVDIWLMNNCPFSYIRERLSFQYPEEFKNE